MSMLEIPLHQARISDSFQRDTRTRARTHVRAHVGASSQLSASAPLEQLLRRRITRSRTGDYAGLWSELVTIWFYIILFDFEYE